MTLIKLKLNLKHLDLALQFGASIVYVSRCVMSWIYFIYQHFKEIDWMPAVDQAIGTMLSCFRKKFRQSMQ